MYNIIQGDNLQILSCLPQNEYNLIYLDPPYGTGKVFSDKNGSFSDKLSGNCFIEWIKPRLIELYKTLKEDGSFFIHMDYREIHYIKVLCDQIFGRNNFQNEIIWHYDFGSRQKKKWSTKHDTILWYTKNNKKYTFNLDQVDLVPKLAPGLPVSKNRKNPHLKTITDTWFCTIVPTNGKERVGYPTQKPLKILERIIKVHTNIGDKVLDPFAGSGSIGEAALKHRRYVTLIDNNIQAIKVMENRLSKYNNLKK